MHYSGAVYRPPSEAYSLIIQVTVGCSHNKCAFCNMYKAKKFSITPIEQVMEDLSWARNTYSRIDRIFLADGDARAGSNLVVLGNLLENVAAGRVGFLFNALINSLGDVGTDDIAGFVDELFDGLLNFYGLNLSHGTGSFRRSVLYGSPFILT